MERLRIGSFSFVAEANPRVTIVGRNGVLVCVTRTIAEMYLRCFVYKPIDEVIERKPAVRRKTPNCGGKSTRLRRLGAPERIVGL